MTEAAKFLYSLLETGEIDEETFADSLDSIGADEKADSYCRIIRQLQADAEALKAEIDRLAAKKKSAENAVKRMKEALLEFVTVACPDGKMKTPLFSVSVRTSQSCEIIDEAAIPDAFRVHQPDKIAKADILKAIRAGETIPGADLIESKSVIIK